MENCKKVAIIGDRACGQSSLLAAFSNIIWPGVFVPSVFESFDIRLPHDSIKIEIGVWGTTGLEECDLLRTLFYQNTNVILLCYSIDNPDSLDRIPSKWVPEVNQVCPDVPVVLVGNNKHIRNELLKSLVTPVAYEDGMQMSKFIGALAYVECSTKTMDGVDKVFQTAKRFALKE